MLSGLERLLIEAVVAELYVGLLYPHVPGGTEENNMCPGRDFSPKDVSYETAVMTVCLQCL
jgi:hypothetical protein